MLEVLDAHEEPERFHAGTSEIGAEAGSLESTPEVTLLGGIAEAGQPEVRSTRAEAIQVVADRLRPTYRNDGNALGGEIPAATLGERLECESVARTLDKHDRRVVREPL